MSRPITIKALGSRNIDAMKTKEHHVGAPPTSFKNPWPSFQGIGTFAALKMRFGNDPDKNFIPVPEGPNGTRSDKLVKIRKPDWGKEKLDRLKATWIGHASFLVEFPAVNGADRGVRILFDPLFSERTSPFSFMGPKRYTPTPCTLAELPDVDLVCISHNHYDHLDYAAVTELYALHKDRIHFLVPFNDKAWFTEHVCEPDLVTEMDWWESCEVQIEGVGNVQMTCTPSQHSSARSLSDKNHALWCSWCVEAGGKKVYFAGDTGYQHPDAPYSCPAFVEIGKLGPFDLGLLPIGLFKPQKSTGGLHCSPEQSLEIHKEVRSKLSVGMHYGTVRGGVSQEYEEVTEPPRRWRQAAEKEGLWRGGGVEGDGSSIDTSREGVGLCDVGETVVI